MCKNISKARSYYTNVASTEKPEASNYNSIWCLGSYNHKIDADTNFCFNYKNACLQTPD